VPTEAGEDEVDCVMLSLIAFTRSLDFSFLDDILKTDMVKTRVEQIVLG
jgi:hypothetical protein